MNVSAQLNYSHGYFTNYGLILGKSQSGYFYNQHSHRLMLISLHTCRKSPSLNWSYSNTTKQECIPVGCILPTHWPYLIISYACPPTTTLAPRQPHMPPLATTHPSGNHACPLATMHAPQQPHTLSLQPRMPPNHTCPRQPCMAPLATMHAPLWTEWQTGVKILPCPKLRLRAVMKSKQSCVGYNTPVRLCDHSDW